MADLLITNIGKPTEGERLNLTIRSDGSVIEHFYDAGIGKWSSYRSGGVKAKEIPPHERLISADKLADQYFKYLVACYPMMDMAKAKELVGAVKEAVKIAPTVLEASR